MTNKIFKIIFSRRLFLRREFFLKDIKAEGEEHKKEKTFWGNFVPEMRPKFPENEEIILSGRCCS